MVWIGKAKGVRKLFIAKILDGSPSAWLVRSLRLIPAVRTPMLCKARVNASSCRDLSTGSPTGRHSITNVSASQIAEIFSPRRF